MAFYHINNTLKETLNEVELNFIYQLILCLMLQKQLVAIRDAGSVSISASVVMCCCTQFTEQIYSFVVHSVHQFMYIMLM